MSGTFPDQSPLSRCLHTAAGEEVRGEAAPAGSLQGARVQRFTRGWGKDELVWKLFSRTQIRDMHGICYLCASPRLSSALNARSHWTMCLQGTPRGRWEGGAAPVRDEAPATPRGEAVGRFVRRVLAGLKAVPDLGGK